MEEDPSGGSLGGERKGGDRYRSIVEAVRDGIFVVDMDGTVTYVNDAIEAFTGRERDELVGTTFETLVEAGLVRPGEYDRFVTTIEDLAAGVIQTRTLTLEVTNESDRVVEVRVSKHSRGDGTEDIVGVVRDVTERERRARAAERKQAVLAHLYEVGGDASLTFDEKAERILAAGCEYLDLPYGFLTRVEEDVQRMVHTVGDHHLLQPDESAPLEKSYCRRTLESEGLVGIRDARAELGEDDPAYDLFELGCYIGTKVLVGENTYGTFCFAAPQGRDRKFTSDEREVIELLGQWAGYELERLRFEERLEGLHRVSQQLLVAETTGEVATVAVDTAADLLDVPVSAYWEYDPGADVLCPVAETEEAVRTVGEAPTFERGDTLVWESFDSGEIRSYGDLAERSNTYNPETKLRSEVLVPCGTHGILTSSATDPRAFDDVDVESLRLLGALVTEATTAVKHEERLVERGEALQRQNDRLEEFASVVAHDLRNPIAGALASLEIVRKTDDARFLDRAEQALERMNDLVDELLDVARGDRQAVDARTLSLRSTVEEAWSYVDAPDATLSVDDGLDEVRADETRLLQLFGNLFRNSVEHGGDDVTVAVGSLADDEGFYVADDGPGMSDEIRTAVQNFRDADPVPGAGIGLTSVTDVVAGHGWDLSVPSTDQGVRFEIRTGEGIE